MFLVLPSKRVGLEANPNLFGIWQHSLTAKQKRVINMAYERKDGDIAVFKVKDKTNERGPDWTGVALIDGVEKQISLWLKSDTMLAGQIKDKWDGGNKTPPKPFAPAHEDDLDTEIPF